MGWNIIFYIFRVSTNGVQIYQPTVRATAGTSFWFSNLMEGTTYTLDVDAIISPPEGGQFDVLDLVIPYQYVTTLCKYYIEIKMCVLRIAIIVIIVQVYNSAFNSLSRSIWRN